jgi:hypothetical protein
MAFRVRDLMITVLPPEGGPIGCIGFTFPNCGGTCRITDFCGAATPCAIGTRCIGNTRCVGLTGLGGCGSACSLTPCTDGCSRCTDNATPCHTPTTGLVGFVNDDELRLLKTDLQGALAQVEAEESGRRERGQPQTVEEIDRLEAEISGALEELKRRREELQGSSDDG